MRPAEIAPGEHSPRAAGTSESGKRRRPHHPPGIYQFRHNGHVLRAEIEGHNFDYDGRKAVLAVIKDLPAPSAPATTATEIARAAPDEKFFRGLLEATPDSIVIVDPRGRIVRLNAQTERLFGYGRDELIGKSIELLMPRRFRSKHRAETRDYFKEPRVHPGPERVGLELRGLAKDGREFPVEISVGPVQTKDGILAVAVIRDVTPLKYAEEAYRSLVEYSIQGMVVFQRGRVAFVNGAMAGMLGYSVEELKALNLRTVGKLIHPDERKRILLRFRDRLAGKPVPEHYEVHALRKDGKPIWIEAYIKTINYRGQPAIQGTTVDITQRKQAEDALRESEAQYKRLFQAAPIGIGLADLSGNLLAFNDAILKPGGYSRSDILKIGNVSALYADPVQRDQVLALFRRQGYVMGQEVQFKRKDGSAYEARLSLTKVDIDGSPRIQALVEDITASKQAEMALRASEQNYRALFDEAERRAQELALLDQVRSALAGQLELSGVFRAVVEAIANTFGYTLVSLYMVQDDMLVLQHQVGYEQMIAQIPITQGIAGRVARTGQAMLLEDVRSDPAFLGAIEGIVSEVCVPLPSQGGVVGVLNVESTDGIQLREEDLRLMTSIAEYIGIAMQRARLYTKLIESEERYRVVSEVTSDYAFVDRVEPDGRIMPEWITGAFMQITGYSLEDAQNPDFLKRLVHPDDLPMFLQHMARILSGEKDEIEVRILTKTGELRWWREAVNPIWDATQSRVARLYGGVQDITEHKQAERESRESQERFASAFRSSPTPMALTTLADGRTTDVNEAFCELFGYSREEVVGHTSLELGIADPASRQQAVELLGDKRFIRNLEQKARNRAGLQLNILNSIETIKIGDELYALSTIIDITERKRAEEALRSSEAELRALFDAIPDLIMVVDKDGKYLKVTPGEAGVLSRSTEDVLGKRMHDLFSRPKADEFVGHIREALATRKSVRFEYALLITDQVRWFSGAVAPLTPETVVWVARDITPQKHAEYQAQRRVDELEALYESGLALSHTFDPGEISKIIIKVLASHLNWHHAAVRVRRGDTDEVELLAFSEARGQADTAADAQTLARGAITKIGQGMAGWVMQHGRIVKSGSLSDDPRYHQTFANMRSGLYVPIWAGGHVLGCISVESDQAEAFGDADELLLTTLASQAAAALENARLFAETRRRLHELESLSKASEALTGTLQLEPLLENILRSACQALPAAEKGTILLRSENEPGHLRVRAQVGYADSRLLDLPFDAGKGYSGRAFHEKRPILIRDALAEYEIPFNEKLEEVNAVQSGIVAPLLAQDEAIGAIALDNASRRSAFDEEDLRLLVLFASSAAVVIENARLFEQTKRRAHEFEALYGMTRDLSSHQQDLALLLPNMIEKAVQLVGGYGGGIDLYDPARAELDPAAVFNGKLGRNQPVKLGEGAIGRVAESRIPLVIDDYQTWEGHSSLANGIPYRAMVLVPMSYAGELIGVLGVFEYGDSDRKFNEADVQLLSLFAGYAAGVVHSARLFAQTVQKADQFASLYETAQDLSAQQDVGGLLNVIVERAALLLHAPVSGVYLYDKAQEDLYVAVNSGRPSSLGVRLAMGEGIAGQVAQSRRSMIVDDYQTWEGRSPKYDGIPIRSVLEVPMLYGGDLIGVLTVDEIGESQRKFIQEDAHLLSLFASYAAGAVHTARLFEQTRRRVEELDSMARVSTALRVASAYSEMPPIILSLMGDLLGADGTMFAVVDAASGNVTVELAQGSLAHSTGSIIPVGQGLTAQVIRSGRLYATEDLRAVPGVFAADLLATVRAAAIVPLIARGRVIGAIWITRAEKDGVQPPAFEERELRLASAIADISANAIQRVLLFEQTTHYAEQLVTINAMGHALSETLELPAIYEKVARSTLELFPGTATVHISLFDPQMQLLNAAYGLQDGELVNIAAVPSMRIDEAGTDNQSQVILRGEPLIVPDPNRAANGGANGAYDETAQSALYAPMSAEGHVIGVLQLQSHAKHRYGREDAELLELAANTAGVAIQNARLFTQLKRRVNQLSALHAVDMAIGSTTDLRVSLQAVLENISRQLQVDAADVLLLNPSSLVLQYAAGIGFLTSEIMRSTSTLGKGRAGRAALDRQTTFIPDLTADQTGFLRSNLVAAERFIGYLVVPLIAKGEVKGVLEIFHRSPLALDDERRSLLEMLAGQASLAIDNALLFESQERANLELTVAYDATIEGWSQALELRDQETRGHSARVLDLTLRLAAAVGVSDKEIQAMRRGVLLHDIGKMGIPDAILHKPGPLTDEEWQVMRRHPQYAYDMLGPIVYLRNSLDIPYAHHEKWDGSGYPRGLKGGTIPLSARIFCVVDVFDALTSQRDYRGAWPKERAIEYIIEQSGKHFDPNIVDAFIKVVEA